MNEYEIILGDGRNLRKIREMSNSSGDFLKSILDEFPDARIVSLVRILNNDAYEIII